MVIIPLFEFQIGSNVDEQRRSIVDLVNRPCYFFGKVLKLAIVVGNTGVGYPSEVICIEMIADLTGNTVGVKELLYFWEVLSFGDDEAHLTILLLV